MEEQKEEPPVLPVGSSSGGAEAEASGGVVNVRVDEVWHVSTMPEVKQYFSQDVSTFSRYFVTGITEDHNFFLHLRKICLKLP